MIAIGDPSGEKGILASFRSVAPELEPLIDRLGSRDAATEGELIKINRNGTDASLRASVSRICNDIGETEGFVVAFDDVTDLLKLQQQAALGKRRRKDSRTISETRSRR